MSGKCSGNNISIEKGVCTELKDVGDSCSLDSECKNDACGRPNAKTSDLECCASGSVTRYLLKDYCTEMPDGTDCRTDAMCKSDSRCINNKCTKLKNYKESCNSQQNAECKSDKCYRTERYGNYKCCKDTNYCNWYDKGCSTGYYYCAFSGLG